MLRTFWSEFRDNYFEYMKGSLLSEDCRMHIVNEIVTKNALVTNKTSISVLGKGGYEKGRC